MHRRQAESAATDGTVYLGDKKKGKDFYGEYNATYVPDLIKIKAGEKPRCGEVKNYSPYVRPATNRPAGFELNGGKFLCGNTEERLKHRVLGTRRRGLSTMEPYDHKTGAGYVPRHDGDYRDAIVNRKADVTLYVHESLGGMAPSAVRAIGDQELRRAHARHLRRRHLQPRHRPRLRRRRRARARPLCRRDGQQERPRLAATC